MVRKDFVSNSSSCSFIVLLKSKKDIEQFKSISEELMKCATLEAYENLGNATNTSCEDYVPPETITKDNIDKIKKGQSIQVYFGEDHSEYNIDECINWGEKCEELFKGKVYRDVDAHYSAGKKCIIVKGRQYG